MLVLAVLASLLLALHGHVLRWPFISDDYVFLSAIWTGSAENFFGVFNTVQNYFRPLGRELYFYGLSLILGNDPLLFRLVNFALLLGTVALVIELGSRLAGLRAGLLAGTLYALLYPHRVQLAWVSCSQDLLATLLAQIATVALLRDRRGVAAGLYFLALFSKESVAPLPLILAIWVAWSAAAPQGRWRAAAQRTWPLWCAAGCWAVIVVSVRVWRGAWAPGSTVPVADVSIQLGTFWEGFKSALLTYFYAEQPWTYLRRAIVQIEVPWVPIGLAAAAGALAFAVPLATGDPATRRPSGRDAWRLGLVWALLGALPIALVGHHFSAYYVSFAAVGFSVLAGWGLARPPLAVAIVVLGLAAVMNVAANTVENFRIFRNEDDLPGVSYVSISRLGSEARFLDSLSATLRKDPPPRGAVIYLSHAPHFATFATSGELAPRAWFRDPGLNLISISQYHPRTGGGRAARFVRFDPDRRSFVLLPKPLVDTIVEGEEALARGDCRAAEAALERALALARPVEHDIERVELENSIGVAASQCGEPAKARQAWLAALAIRPDHRGALLNLAGFEAAARRYHEAAELVRRNLSAREDDALGLYYLARLERAMGNDSRARDAWARLVAAHPGFADSVARASGVP